MGLYNHHKGQAADKPLVPCSDMCGIVTSIGPGPHKVHWKVGDRVLSTFNQTHLTGQIKAADMGSGLGKPLDGVLQTYRVFPSTGLVKCPEYLSDEEACCLPIAAVTAWTSINGFRPLGQPGGKGETVVLQGTGGVAISGVQIAHASGAKGTEPGLVLIALYVIPNTCSCDHLILRRKAAKGRGAGCGPCDQLPHKSRLAGRGHEDHEQ